MHTLVLQGSSVSVKLEGAHFLVQDHAREVAAVRVPLAGIDRVVAFGQPAISFPALAKLMDLRIPCSFLSSSGRWRGALDMDRGYHAERRMRQYRSLEDPDFVLAVARRVVAAKIRNGRRTLQRLAANRKIETASLLGYPALALDLMEPFRPMVADRLALDLLNHRRLTGKDHFRQCEEDGGVYLNEAGRSIVFRAYDEVMRRCSETTYGRLTVRRQMDRAVCGFLKMLGEGEAETAIPLSA